MRVATMPAHRKASQGIGGGGNEWQWQRSSLIHRHCAANRAAESPARVEMGMATCSINEWG
jgi:hypothetical protein